MAELVSTFRESTTDPIVTPPVSPLIRKLLSRLSKESELQLVDVQAMEKLQTTLSTIILAVEDAEKKRTGDGSLCNRLKELRDVAYDVDDLLDEVLIEGMRLSKGKGKGKGKVKGILDQAMGQVHGSSFSSPDNLVSHRTITIPIKIKINDLIKRLDRVTESFMKFYYGFENSRLLRKSISSWRQEPSESLEDLLASYSAVESRVYGRDMDKEKVVNFLVNEEDSDNHFSVLAIVGVGGVGKTTLAQLAFNDVNVQHLFDLKIWVCVSDEFYVSTVLIQIPGRAASKREQMYHLLELETLHKLLQETTGGKRFLLVLDDVWDEDPVKWESLKISLTYGSKGSKIVVTTQSKRIARVMGSVPALYLEVLSADHCWSLFKERAFGAGREEETPYLVSIRKQIISYCGGLPLAAKALGSLMGSKGGEYEWFDVQSSNILIFSDEGRILPSLRLSYYHLPSHLKLCFSYCSLFPKNYVLVKKKLVRLWIGAGLIHSSDEGMNLEDIAEEYFNFLLRMSFFQDEAKDDSGNIVSCKMHSLFHDLACYVANEDSHSVNIGCMVSHAHHHLSMISNGRSSSGNFTDTPDPKKLRSLLVFGETRHLTQGVEMFLSSATHLRVLSGIPITKFPGAIRKLIHLRLLDLSNTMIDVLPESISSLCHLQLLDLSDTEIGLLPESFTGLYNLQTLDLQSCRKLLELPLTFGALKNLRMLNLSHSSIQALPESITDLHSLQNLDLRNCKQLQELPLAIGKLENLRLLDLSHSSVQLLPESTSGL